jgi:hypothetical protein
MLVETYHVGFRKLVIALSVMGALYYGTFLSLYYTTMHGDRPRWGEAVNYYSQISTQSDSDTERIRATVPAVVAHYLGVGPSKTMSQTLVSKIPNHPPLQVNDQYEWHIVKQDHVSEEYEKWYQVHCKLKGRFPAYTGFINHKLLKDFSIDRSVSVYFCPGLPL